DADDIWSPTFLEELLEFLSKTGFDMVYADAEQFLSGKNKKIGNFLRFNPQQGEVTREMGVAGKCIILPSGTLIKRSTFIAAGGFDPNVSRTEDSDLWMRLLFNGARIGYLRKILFRFRISPGSGSGNLIERIERDVIRWRTLQKKLAFTDEENRIVEAHIARDKASVLRAKGRIYLEAGEWQLARQMFLEAKQKAAELKLPLVHRLKLRMVLFMLRVWPPALRQMFRQFRGDEIDFMPKEKLQV
ncbi:MAG: hypothetical protein PSX80_12430, partial [bacterium]|nr:hypothetical protein [bacterium]